LPHQSIGPIDYNETISTLKRAQNGFNILSYWDIPPSVHDKMHGHATAIGQTSLFGCSSAGHSGINQLGGVYVNGELHNLLSNIALIHADGFSHSDKLFQVVHFPTRRDKKLLSSLIQERGLVIFPAYYRFPMDVLVKY
jgi:hypothetical protein